jgi:hypothetical protein
MWDRGLRVRNITFINFADPGTQAIYGPFIIGRCVVYCGGMRKKKQMKNYFIYSFLS